MVQMVLLAGPSAVYTLVAVEQNKNKQTSRQMNMSLAAVSGRDNGKGYGVLAIGICPSQDELSEAEQAVDTSALLHYEG